VPLMTVVLSIAGAFPVFANVQNIVQNFIFTNFVPTFGLMVQQYLQQFALNASRLTAVGILFLVMTSLLMISTIDNSFNRIWRTRAKRRGLANFTVYWAVLSLGPILIAASLLLTSEIFSDLKLTIAAESLGVQGILLDLTPFFATTLALFLLYVVVPNRLVPLSHAFIGAVIAALFFEAAKHGFTLYLTKFPTYETIFGAMAVVPIFLIWIYTSWLMALLGAEITHSLSAFPATLHIGNSSNSELFWAFRLLGHLWEAQRKGNSLPTRVLLAWEPGLSEEMLTELIKTFATARLIQRTADGAWVLVRDLTEITLLDLYQILPHSIKELDNATNDLWNTNLNQVIQQFHGEMHKIMNIPLKNLYTDAREN